MSVLLSNVSISTNGCIAKKSTIVCQPIDLGINIPLS